MKIKKPLLLPLLAAVVLPCVCVLPTSAHSAFQPRLSLDSGSDAVCKPVVQLSRHRLDSLYNAIRLEVSPCAVTALQQGSEITIQADKTINGSITEQDLQAYTPEIKQGLIGRMSDILHVQPSCLRGSVSLSSPVFAPTFFGPTPHSDELEMVLWNLLPNKYIGPFQIHTSTPFTCQS
jgi:hypothetical protein